VEEAKAGQAFVETKFRKKAHPSGRKMGGGEKSKSTLYWGDQGPKYKPKKEKRGIRMPSVSEKESNKRNG